MTAHRCVSESPSAEELWQLSRSFDIRDQVRARAARPDFDQWLWHVKPAAACASPIRLAGDINHVTVHPDGAWSYTTRSTFDMPDGVIYKACGNRRASACPSCSNRYKRDAYEIIRTMLVGGRGVPETVAQHPAAFPTFTAPSFGPVHTRVVDRHTCVNRGGCDCRPRPCNPNRQHPVCPHGRRIECYARHDETDKALGTPLCLDCYDHDAQVVWNVESGELWRRTQIKILRFLQRRARQRGIDPKAIKLTYGKAAEFQRRAVIHLHAIMRLDRIDPTNPEVILPRPGSPSPTWSTPLTTPAR